MILRHMSLRAPDHERLQKTPKEADDKIFRSAPLSICDVDATCDPCCKTRAISVLGSCRRTARRQAGRPGHPGPQGRIRLSGAALGQAGKSAP